MPSPVGHALAGATIAFAADQRLGLSRPWRYAVPICALLAASPDLDLLYPGGHRSATHSLTAVACVFVLTGVFTRWWSGRADLRMSAACAAAYGSHLLADFLGVDPGTPAGIQLFWPISQGWFISDWLVFLATERHEPLSAYAIAQNAAAFLQELAVIGPLLAVAWLRRRRLTAGESALVSQASREHAA